MEIRGTLREYAAWLQVDSVLSEFLKQELAELLRRISTASRALVDRGRCGKRVALRPIDDEICEMKRLYVREDQRGVGAGKAVECWRSSRRRRGIGVSADEARYHAEMDRAQGLYASLGFRDIARASLIIRSRGRCGFWSWSYSRAARATPGTSILLLHLFQTSACTVFSEYDRAWIAGEIRCVRSRLQHRHRSARNVAGAGTRGFVVIDNHQMSGPASARYGSRPASYRGNRSDDRRRALARCRSNWRAVGDRW